MSKAKLNANLKRHRAVLNRERTFLQGVRQFGHENLVDTTLVEAQAARQRIARAQGVVDQAPSVRVDHLGKSAVVLGRRERAVEKRIQRLQQGRYAGNTKARREAVYRSSFNIERTADNAEATVDRATS